jgi:PhnB protein
MKSIIANLAVENCQEALAFYQDVFGGEIKNTQLADGVEMFKGHEGKYIHSELHINESCILYLTDIFAKTHVSGNNFQLVMEMSSEEEIMSAYEKLAESGEVTFQLNNTFWGAKHGVVKDRFGITWGLNFTQKQ